MVFEKFIFLNYLLSSYLLFIKINKTNGYRYGAWYLPKKHWKYAPSEEKLIDPKVLKEAEKDESKKKSEEIVFISYYFFYLFKCLKYDFNFRILNWRLCMEPMLLKNLSKLNNLNVSLK